MKLPGGTTASSSPCPPVTAWESRFAQEEGSGAVHFRQAGAGEPALVFVHGWGGNTDFWRANAPAFADRHRVLLVDLPGHGQSALLQHGHTIKAFAEAVRATLDAAKVEQAVIIGHSLGAAVACRLLRDHPRRVTALVTVDGALVGYPVTEAQREQFLSRFRGASHRDEVRQFVGALFRQKADPALRERIVEDILRTTPAVLVEAFADLLQPDNWELAMFPAPLLLVNAPSPLWNEAYLTEVRHRARRGMEVQFIRGAGHFLILEDPAAFNTALHSFLDRLSLANGLPPSQSASPLSRP